jgi:hypothetical protein
MITVTTPAATTALTTLANVKLSLCIENTYADAWLTKQIDVISLVACEVLGVEMAEDGSRHFGVETVSETQDRRTRQPWLPPFGVNAPRREADTFIVLGRRPIIAIQSITENGCTLDPCQYEISATDGKIKRIESNLAAAWPCALLVINYTAGWLLPGDTNTNMPVPIEDAVIEGIQARYFSRGRDPNVRSQNLPGILETSYFFGAPGQDQPLPPGAMSKLNPYRNMSL